MAPIEKLLTTLAKIFETGELYPHVRAEVVQALKDTGFRFVPTSGTQWKDHKGQVLEIEAPVVSCTTDGFTASKAHIYTTLEDFESKLTPCTENDLEGATFERAVYFRLNKGGREAVPEIIRMVEAHLGKEPLQVQRKGEADLPYEIKKLLREYSTTSHVPAPGVRDALEAACKTYGYSIGRILKEHLDSFRDTKPRAGEIPPEVQKRSGITFGSLHGGR